MCFRERRCSKKALQTDASGCFIVGKDSIPMRLWQHADACGKLHYSLIPVLDSVAKTEEGISVLNASPLAAVKIEETEDQSSDQRTNSCNTSRYVDSSTRRLREIVVDGYTCDKCGVKFPIRSMLKRHKVTHNVRSRLHGRHSMKQRHTRHLKVHARSGRSQVRRHSKRAKHTCARCDFSCDRAAALTAHLKRKHKEDGTRTDTKNLVCTICGHECSSQVILNMHMRKHGSENMTSFTCDMCDFKCKRSTTLASHLARDHKTPKKNSNIRAKNTRHRATKYNHASSKKINQLVCSHSREAAEKVATSCKEPSLAIKEEICVEDCGETSMSAADIPKVSSSRKNVEVHCDLCDFTCTKKSTLYSHKRRHKVENEVFACNECSFKTIKKSSLYSHIKRKHKEPRSGGSDAQQPELFYCSQCDYKNKNKYELKVHVARKHSDDFKFSCETCGKKFKVKGDLTNHIRFSHREQPVICDVCGKTCLNSNSLYVHQKFAHYKAKYECQVCKRRMVSQENLNEHMLRQHERRENVVCEECGKTFSRNSRLKVHMRIHTGDKPYSCTICNKSFARRTALKQHLLIHTGIRPYVCDICGKAFTQKPGLISHRKSHPGSHPPLPRVLIDHILNDVMNA